MKSPEWVVVFDCDGTLIPKSYGSLYDVVDKNGGLTEEHLRAAEEMRKHYLSLPTLTPEDQQKWFIDTVNGYIESGLTLGKIREILREVRLREGVLECLRFLREKNAPAAVVSYGITQFIETALAANGAGGFVNRVYAAELTMTPRGIVYGFDIGDVVFPSNKGKYSRVFAKLHGVPKERILAVGDSHVGDRFLGHLKENRLGIAEDAAQAEKLKECMGHVVISHDFAPVTRWLEEKMDGK